MTPLRSDPGRSGLAEAVVATRVAPGRRPVAPGRAPTSADGAVGWPTVPTVWPAGSEPAEVPEPIPAATVVILRDGPQGLETLLLRRNTALAFAGGAWVFPGGRIEDLDRSASAHDQPVAADQRGPADLGAPGMVNAARRAAVREAGEEAGVVLDPASLVWFSHWTPPPVSIKRYATWFFAAADPGDARPVTVDGDEIHEHAWVRPDEARARRNAGEIELTPPTWITLEHLHRFRGARQALESLAGLPVERFETRFTTVGDDAVALYHGDVAYDDLDAATDRPGGRHRLWMVDSGWRYEREPQA